MVTRDRIVVSLNDEGPCAESLGLYSLLDRLCAEFNYNKNRISIITANLLETHDEYIIIKRIAAPYLKTAQQIVLDTSKNKNLKHFGNFIGHGNIHRLHMSSYINDNFKGITLQSYHTDTKLDYHRRFIGLEDMLCAGLDIQPALDLIAQSPKRIDNIDEYPILCPATYNIAKVYPDIFVEIVSLTYFSGNTIHLDEKIWRPILMKTPFIVQGPTNFIKNLRHIGFKTFDKWWPEGYSEDSADAQVNSIKHVLNDIAQLNTSQLLDMYTDMACVLDHNYEVFMNLTSDKLHLIFNNA